MPRTRKQRGGSLASDNVNALVAKSCSRFAYPAKVRAVMTASPAHAHSTPPHQQSGGGNLANTTSWFYTTFVPHMTRACLSLSTTDTLKDTLDEMQAMWNAEHPHAKLSKRAAKQMLREFVGANQNTTDAEADEDHVNVPLQWMNTATPSSTYNMVGGASNCLYDTNYTVHQNDVYDRYRGNTGGSPPMGATVPQDSFKGLYNWFHGRSTLFAPSTNNPMHQNQVNYLSQSGPNDPIQVAPLNSTVKAQVPVLHGNTESMGVFPASSSTNYASYTRQTPMARGGGSRRRRGRRGRSVRSGRRGRSGRRRGGGKDITTEVKNVCKEITTATPESIPHNITFTQLDDGRVQTTLPQVDNVPVTRDAAILNHSAFIQNGYIQVGLERNDGETDATLGTYANGIRFHYKDNCQSKLKELLKLQT